LHWIYYIEDAIHYLYIYPETINL